MSKNPLLFKGNCMQIFLFGVIHLKLQILFLILFRTAKRFYFGSRLYHIPLRIDLLLFVRDLLFKERFQSCWRVAV